MYQRSYYEHKLGTRKCLKLCASFSLTTVLWLTLKLPFSFSEKTSDNSLPNDKTLDWSKLKAFVDDKSE